MYRVYLTRKRKIDRGTLDGGKSKFSAGHDEITWRNVRAHVTVRIFLQRVVSFPPSLIDVDRFALTRAGSE